jgi:hypothetical protein
MDKRYLLLGEFLFACRRSLLLFRLLLLLLWVGAAWGGVL